MYDTVARTFQEPLPRFPPAPCPLYLYSETSATFQIKPGQKAGAMKSSPEKAFRKLGKILFTFPRRAKTMVIKAESLSIREPSSLCHRRNQI